MFVYCIGGNSIDFVESFMHLGHVISSKLDDCEDKNRRCNFIGQANCSVYFVTLVSLIVLLSISCSGLTAAACTAVSCGH